MQSKTWNAPTICNSKFANTLLTKPVIKMVHGALVTIFQCVVGHEQRTMCVPTPPLRNRNTSHLFVVFIFRVFEIGLVHKGTTGFGY